MTTILTSDESITDVVKFQKLDYVLHVSNLLLVWHRRGLP